MSKNTCTNNNCGTDENLKYLEKCELISNEELVRVQTNKYTHTDININLVKKLVYILLCLLGNSSTTLAKILKIPVGDRTNWYLT